MDLPKPTLERFIQLSRLLGQINIQEYPQNIISSAQISTLTGWSSYTIRKDISQIPNNGAVATGYTINLLKNAIRKELGIGDEQKKCCIVGLGRLGSAFLDYEGFNATVFDMIAGFDSNVNRTEILNTPFPLYPTSKMESIIKNEHIEYAILAVPINAALQTAQRLVDCGIKGIVNFTSQILPPFEYVQVENVSTIEALYSLVAKVSLSNKEIT